MSSAHILDFQQFQQRRALRDCGADSRRREFLWVDPLRGQVQVRVFRPARPSAAEALRLHAGRRG
ncbi:MAG: hypothetical protein QM601_11760 [Pseudoxanthomonas sp.]